MDVVQKFRHDLRNLKESILKNNVYKSQDPNKINEIESKIKGEFIRLREILRHLDVPSDLKKKMMYHLRRDLFTFPYTLDEYRIDEFPDEDVVLRNDDEENETEENKNRRFEVEYG
jgi:hypothetical protein